MTTPVRTSGVTFFISGDRKVSFPTLYPESFPGYRTAQVSYGFGEANILLLRVMLLIQATIKIP